MIIANRTVITHHPKIIGPANNRFVPDDRCLPVVRVPTVTKLVPECIVKVHPQTAGAHMRCKGS